MDYYTRTTFEFQSAVLGAQSGVGGGGRYDDLVEMIGGPPTPGVGFGTGVERILLALARSRETTCPTPRGPPPTWSPSSDAGREPVFALAHELRTAGVAAELDYQRRSVKGQMKQAGGSGARFAVILGDEELAAGDGHPQGSRHWRRRAPATYRSHRTDRCSRRGRHELPDALVRRDHGGPGGTASRRRRVGAPPAGSRGSGVHRPARPHRTGPAGLRPRGRRRRHETARTPCATSTC